METYLIENLPQIKTAAEKAANLEELTHHYSTIDLEIKKLTEIKDLLKNKILPMFEKVYGHQGCNYENPTTGDRVQRVLSVYQNANESKLKKLLSLEQWKKVVEEKVSVELLLAAIKMGIINPLILQEGITTKEVDKLVVRRPK